MTDVTPGPPFTVKNARGQYVCRSALRKRPHVACMSPFIMQNGRCILHGGPSPKGPAQPAWIDGRASKYLPAALRDRYEAALADPELLKLEHQIALLDVRLGQACARVEGGESVAAWHATKTAYEAHRAALTSGDKAALPGTVQALDAAFAADPGGVWREILDLIERRRKLVDSVHRRNEAGQHTVEVGQLYAVVDRLLLVVMKFVTEQSARTAIGVEFERVMASGTPLKLIAGGRG